MAAYECIRSIVGSVMCIRNREVDFFFKQKAAYEMLRRLVGSEMCIRVIVIIGKLIPAGSGLSAYRHIAEELVPAAEEEQEEPAEVSGESAGVEALQADAAQVLEETPAEDAPQDQE